MFRRLLILMAAALVSVVVVAGCGDDDSGASGDEATITTSSLSKEQFVQRANAACEQRKKQLTKEINAYARKTEREKPDASATEVFTGAAVAAGLPAFQDMIDSLRELGAPEGDEEELEALLAEMQQGVDKLERQLPDESGRLGQNDRFFRTLDSSAAMARRYGIGACALS